MLVSIANRSGHDIDGAFAAKFISTVGAGAIAYYGGCKAATWLFHLIPGAGTLTAMGISSALNALFTYKFGAAVSNQFDRADFDLNDAAVAAASILAVLCTFPTLDDIKGLIDLQGVWA